MDMTKHDKVAKLTEITNIGVNKFKTNIEKQWGNFANISDIELHKTTPKSYPKNDPSDISIIKFRNYKKYLFDKINEDIEKLILALNEQINYNDIPINYINYAIFKFFIEDNKEIIITKHGNIFDINCVNSDLLQEYKEYNENYKVNSVYDFADNIIDLNNNIFIGGARTVTITNDINFSVFEKDTFEQIISSLLYTLVLPFDKANLFNNNYDLYNESTDININELYNNIILFIYNTIINNQDDTKDRIKANINNNKLNNFTPIFDLLNRNEINLNILEHHEKIKYIYYFMNIFLSCKKREDNKSDNDNLNINMNICCILLVAGMINTKKPDNLIISIQQSFIPLLLNSIYVPDTKYGFIISTENKLSNYYKAYSILICYIYALFSNENINDIYKNIVNTNIDANEDNLDEQLTNIINNLNVDTQLIDILLEVIKLFKIQSSPKKLANMVIEYYNDLEQPPQSLHIADLIAIIRDGTEESFYNTNSDKLFNRLTNLLVQTYILKDFTDNAGIVTKHIQIDNYSLDYIDNDFYNIINNDLYAETIKLINDFALPSRINYYIYLDNSRYDDFCSYKFIESYYLGLNFMGIIPQLDTIDDMEVNYKGTDETIQTKVNLFNVNPNITKYDINFFNTDNIIRTTNIYTIANVFNDYFIKIGKMLNTCFSIIKTVFNDFKQSHSSTKYMTTIINLYPILLNLINNCKLIEKYKNDSIKIYSEQYKYIKSIINVDIDGIINSFNYSKFSIKHFENIINNINGLIFILYYVSDNDTKKMKIPKLLYYSLGSKPLIGFDNNIPIEILNPDTDTSVISTNTNIIDEIKNEMYTNIFFDNVIKNNLFLYKNVLYDDYITSRENKLPPSISELFYEFYKINIIKTIIDKLDRDEENYIDDNDLINLELHELNTIQDTLVNEINKIEQQSPIDSDLLNNKNQQLNMIMNIIRIKIDNNVLAIPTNLNTKLRKIQLKYIKAKIIEELIKLYLKNRVIKYSIEKYEKHFLENVKNTDINIEQIFKYNDLKYGFGLEDRYNEYKNEILLREDTYKLFYEFSKPKDIKQQFYIYPDNYFSTNRINNKLIVLFKPTIFNKLLNHGCDILAHNNERISPLNMLIKNYYYDCIDIIKEHIDLRTIDRDYSPFNYLLKSYKLHLENYNNFIYNQYNDIVQIIQANESFYNNIPKYLETSFKIIKYVTEHFLIENIPDTNIFNTDPVNINYKYDACPFITFVNNKKIILFKSDTDLIKLELKNKFTKLKDKIFEKIKELEKEKQIMKRSSKLIDDKIIKLNEEYKKYSINDITITYIDISNSKFKNVELDDTNIINRYSSIPVDSNFLSYLHGWEQFFNLDIKLNDVLSLPVKLVNYQLDYMTDTHNDTFNDIFNKKLQKILPFYEKNYNIIRDYFEKPRYSNKNDIVKFVYDLLLHLTKTFICSAIENIIKKVLFEYITQIEMAPVDFILDKVEYIFNPIKEHLYDIIPEIFVSNSVNIYKDIDDTLNKEIQTVSMVLTNLLDLLKSSSPIEIDEYTINLLKNNFVMYFDTIVWKTINNWNVVIENIFMFHINQYRILQCINKLLN